jgi:hypothetical protein
MGSLSLAKYGREGNVTAESLEIARRLVCILGTYYSADERLKFQAGPTICDDPMNARALVLLYRGRCFWLKLRLPELPNNQIGH